VIALVYGLEALGTSKYGPLTAAALWRMNNGFVQLRTTSLPMLCILSGGLTIAGITSEKNEPLTIRLSIWFVPMPVS